MAKKTFTRWTWHTAEEAAQRFAGGEHLEDVFCEDEYRKFCVRLDDICDTCHAVKVTIKAEDV